MGICESTSKAHPRPTKNLQSRYTNKNFVPNQEFLLPPDLSIRDEITKYYSLKPEFIGQGSSGVVFEGTDKNNKKYAVKQINKMVIKDIHSVLLEAEISSLVHNEHIVKCYGVFEDSKSISIVLELFEGGDLFYFISNSPQGKLSDKIACDLIIQILETIQYLHNEMNIVHRDIKPENFLISFEDGVPKIKLIDFGFACFIPKDVLMEESLGSPSYLAPEICAGFPYNKNIDIWSAGVILFNMLTGTQPFNTDNEELCNEDIVSAKIPFENIENIEMRKLCMAMMERDPSLRLNADQALKMAKNIIIEDNSIEIKKKLSTQESERTRLNTEKSTKKGFIFNNQQMSIKVI